MTAAIQKDGQKFSKFLEVWSQMKITFLSPVNIRTSIYIYIYIYIYVVVNFSFQLIYNFPLFWGIVMYANEFKTKEKQN